jgi:predicted nucleic acid-binding protein
MIYLDSAAIVKLAHLEPDSHALRAWLSERAESGWVSSVLVEVEAFRALAWHTPSALSRLPPILDLVALVDLDPAVRMLAQTVSPPAVGSLDAIHLATALHAGAQLTSFVTYDTRLANAAAAAGLGVDMPRDGR